MFVIASREEFFRIVADVRRVARELAVSAPALGATCQQLERQVDVACAPFDPAAAAALNGAASGVDFASSAQLLAAAQAHAGDERLRWLLTILPSLDHFFRADQSAAAAQPADDASDDAEVVELGDEDLLEAGEAVSFPVGAHVCVYLPSGGPYLGFVRHLQQDHVLVALANGYQQWFTPAQLHDRPGPGDAVAALDEHGQPRPGTLVRFARGQYLVELGSGDQQWIDWTALQARAAPRS